MGYSVSSEEDLVAASAGDRKPGQHSTMPHKEYTKRVGGSKYTRFDDLRDNDRPDYSNYKLKNWAEGDHCIAEGLQEFRRVNVLELRKGALKSNPSDLRDGLEQMIHTNNNKGGRRAPEGELKLTRGRFNVNPSAETNQDEQMFQDSAQVGSLVCTQC
jgi:hypothetical protein